MIPHLPAVNAALNFASAVLLASGYLFIRQKNVVFHRACMVSAFLVSTAFLVSYVTYHLHAGHVAYQGHLRAVYFTILISHSILAMAIVPLVLRTLFLALRSRFDSHRQLARWTLPIWLYVSVTGVVIYEMLY